MLNTDVLDGAAGAGFVAEVSGGEFSNASPLGGVAHLDRGDMFKASTNSLCQ